MTAPTYIIMPILGAREYTTAAIADCLQQSVPTRLLLINQGVDDPFRDELERVAEEYDDQILLWHHQPPLPSLSATWNRALDFVWEVGGTEALVINNDVRIHRETVRLLRDALQSLQALFVSAVGVTQEQFDPSHDVVMDYAQHGGPDFSCFLISQTCHLAFRFDAGFIPAYCEDLDYHRRLLLAGHGKDIFSVNLPYLHYAAGTLKQASAGQKAQIEARIAAGSRKYYEKKWGGSVNQETFFTPFDEPMRAEEDDRFYGLSSWQATTPYLQEHPPTLGEE